MLPYPEMLRHRTAVSSLVQPSVPDLIRLGSVANALPLKPRSGHARLGGDYQSPFKGRGMEYNESRPYQPGDDVRHLDWRVTARTGRPHTKLFHEERERPVLMWVDYRVSMQFATRGCFKSVRAAECAALLAWSAAGQGDRVGGVVFTEYSHHELRPRRGRPAVLDLINRLALPIATDDEPRDPQSGLRALTRLARVTRPGSLVFLLSDFQRLDSEADTQIRRLAAHSEVVLVFIHDPLERELPAAGFYRFTDGRREVELATGDAETRRRHAARFDAHLARLQRLAQHANIHLLECSTAADPLVALQYGLGLRFAA